MAKRVTLKEVAAHARVSYQTVSKVLNKQAQVSKLTEDRIWQSIRALGYRPNLIARSLRSQRSHLIGYSWAPTPPDQVNPILDQFLQSMVQVAQTSGYHLLAFPYRQGDEWVDIYRDLIDTNRVDGFVISSIDYDDPRIMFLQEQKFPFVAFGRSNPEWDFPYVDVDGAQGMRMVAEHLVSLGHCRIAILTWPESSRVGQNRMEGLMGFFKQAGLVIPSEWILRGEGNFQFGLQASRFFLDLPPDKRPTAIIAFNDDMAVGAIHAAQQKGLRVGEDLAITGFDDAPMVQYLTPPLTTVRQPIWEVGQCVVSMLADILDKTPSENDQVLLPPKLVIRSSSTFKLN
jgi:DNA-binding LacI/PurR family transcriptional regulator